MEVDAAMERQKTKKNQQKTLQTKSLKTARIYNKVKN